MIRIATFNMESFGGDRPGRDATLERIPVLRARLTSLDADIYCLQEVNAQREPGAESRDLSDLDALVAGTPLADFHHAAAGPGDGLADRHNLVILSRHPIDQSATLMHDRVPPWRLELPMQAGPAEVRFDRPVLKARIALPSGRPLHVFNAHLRAPLAAPIEGEKLSAHTWRTAGGWAAGLSLAALKRMGQALELRLAVDAILDADPDALVAVAGDLNAETTETPLRMLMALPEDTETDALAARALKPVADRIDPDQRFSASHLGRRHLPDHILTSEALAARLIDVRIDNEAVLDDASVPAAFRGSLHAPLSARFDL
ncbi:endonuclease/exonuclease/phosphatase family protein [Amorphus orientalis]|uniref:Endonuclease/exonuclease/phosphatase family metal-dependent hydrolase n=1 Tax=Amorphus orientalis TaxID=649198 RepID=A0AAE4AQG2_9HYPH|nr:endonuclease/exonuclease/phosphatase family protein [Amorphus orientalis]MDQ0314051.1 endonuclease/exonuclease/phosphatase family metal-dependent hydrolase [Amorphus orientalis]